MTDVRGPMTVDRGEAVTDPTPRNKNMLIIVNFIIDGLISIV